MKYWAYIDLTYRYLWFLGPAVAFGFLSAPGIGSVLFLEESDIRLNKSIIRALCSLHRYSSAQDDRLAKDEKYSSGRSSKRFSASLNTE